ncbi:hypothetical protein [Pseudomonas helleri]|uniref:Uncharacterized protein n=1 Tax=Pseudomonas helleri TaxID=1608996 RepID=A0A7X1X026_9PSED|nr:hypothetical protein [Pseudomonas helleri]MQT77668.1 hypothetical protein [Pseudomonas helleri]
MLIKAGQSIRLEAGALIELVVDGSTFTIDADTIAQVASQLNIQGPVTQTGGDFLSNGISAQNHVHIEQGDASPSKSRKTPAGARVWRRHTTPNLTRLYSWLTYCLTLITPVMLPARSSA